MSEIFIGLPRGQAHGSGVAASSYQGQPITGAVRYVDDRDSPRPKHTSD